jgi:hypothetical protein
MFVSCKQAALLMLGMSYLVQSATINHKSFRARDGKVDEPAQFTPGCESPYA